MKSIFGKLIIGVANGLNVILNFFIQFIELLVNITEILREWIRVFGCLLLSMMFFVPLFLFTYRMNPKVFITLLIIWFFPMLGKKFVHSLEYFEYSLIEAMKDYGNYLQGKTTNYRTFSYFSKEFQRREYEEELRRRREYQRQQEEMWEARFREFFGDAFYYTDYTDFSNAGQYRNQQYRQQNQYQAQNPANEFVKQYETYCDTLGVPYDVDTYQLKLQYRKMAKKYHPDLNHEPGAKEQFQKINNAYDFLSNDNNIARYKRFKS